MNRRHFIAQLTSLAGLLAVSAWGGSVLAERKRGGGAPAEGEGGVKIVDPSSPTAKAVNYTENHATVKDAALKIERQGVAFASQKCSSCGFFSNPKTEKGVAVGSCQLFANQFVKAEGWCSSWNKKA